MLFIIRISYAISFPMISLLRVPTRHSFSFVRLTFRKIFTMLDLDSLWECNLEFMNYHFNQKITACLFVNVRIRSEQEDHLVDYCRFLHEIIIASLRSLYLIMMRRMKWENDRFKKTFWRRRLSNYWSIDWMLATYITVSTGQFISQSIHIGAA
jgi:hypothetical protein